MLTVQMLDEMMSDDLTPDEDSPEFWYGWMAFSMPQILGYYHQGDLSEEDASKLTAFWRRAADEAVLPEIGEHYSEWLPKRSPRDGHDITVQGIQSALRRACNEVESLASE